MALSPLEITFCRHKFQVNSTKLRQKHSDLLEVMKLEMQWIT